MQPSLRLTVGRDHCIFSAKGQTVFRVCDCSLCCSLLSSARCCSRNAGPDIQGWAWLCCDTMMYKHWAWARLATGVCRPLLYSSAIQQHFLTELFSNCAVQHNGFGVLATWLVLLRIWIFHFVLVHLNSHTWLAAAVSGQTRGKTVRKCSATLIHQKFH